ncbi:MAG TPA: hypothetical protein VEW07_06360 [Solirubrobacterales bacterium]|nr:hypothetical protein [Solirubrobacterales bacterium]
MSVCLLVIDDGREDYLERCLESAAHNLPPMDACVMVSDPDHELGFAGAVQAGWEGVLETGCEWVFHLESDFVFTCPVDLPKMQAVVEQFPEIAQVALRRQAWNEAEKAAGGIVALDPRSFRTATCSTGYFTEHRKFFTTNPSLYRASLCERGWPQVPRSEGILTHELLSEGRSFAFIGPAPEPPRCWHIGETRTGTGY